MREAITSRHAGLDPVSMDSGFCRNGEQAKWGLISFTLQVSETHGGATPSRRVPCMIRDSSAWMDAVFTMMELPCLMNPDYHQHSCFLE